MIHLTANDKQALTLFKQKLHAALPGQVRDLRLFGSKARGEAAKHSDVDVLVVLNDRSWPVRQRIHQLAGEVFLATEVDLSVKIITPAIGRRLRQSGSPLMANIDRDGMAL